MFGIDEGKNLVRDKLYDFFMMGYNKDDFIDIDTLISNGLDSIQVGDIVQAKTSYSGSDTFKINGSRLSYDRVYLIANIFVTQNTTYETFSNSTLTFGSLNGFYIQVVRANVTSYNYIELATAISYIDNANDKSNYNQLACWRILRIA